VFLSYSSASTAHPTLPSSSWSSPSDWGWERQDGLDKVTYIWFLACERWKRLIHCPSIRVNGAPPPLTQCHEVDKAVETGFYIPDLPADFG